VRNPDVCERWQFGIAQSKEAAYQYCNEPSRFIRYAALASIIPNSPFSIGCLGELGHVSK
jgi:hypothetical protein